MWRLHPRLGVSLVSIRTEHDVLLYAFPTILKADLQNFIVNVPRQVGRDMALARASLTATFSAVFQHADLKKVLVLAGIAQI